MIFLKAEDGAVTVNWVLMTALAIGMTLSAFYVISNGTNDHADAMATTLEGPRIQTEFPD